ncbi:MAG: hypothetical protein KDI17_03645 [Halioglobus sp.]|nr:hypothetical protein [Halioglobus sp.]
MTFSKTVTYGCMAALAMAVALPGLGATRLYSPLTPPLGSLAPIVLSNADLRSNTTKGYRPWFENGSWQGDLVEYTVTSSGLLSTSVDFTQPSPTNSGANWSALVRFADREAANSNYWDADRKIITWNGSSQVPFRFTDAGIGADNMALLDPNAEDDASSILDYVRGDRSGEYPSGQLRKRTSILGDIIHSKPVYVAAPNANYTGDNYAEWAAGKKDREPRVYVGANDGMLHVFDAETGDEVYAYIPSMLMGSLSALTARPYQHRYYVDGEMSVRDAYFDGDWHTLLAGSLGAGGKGFFALDITDPDLASESANTGTNEKILFEFDASGDNDLGFSFSRPVIARLNDGDWYVITGNGFSSVNGVAILYLVNLEDLTVTKLSTSSGSAASPNGLSSPGLLDTNRDGAVDYAYAGDIDGNLWKFDLSSESANSWAVAYSGTPLHPTAGDQSIIQPPQIARHPQNGYMLYFATGRLLSNADLTNTSVQSLYGIWDSGNTPPDAGNQALLTQTWDGPKTYDYPIGESTTATQTIAIYNEDAGDPDWETHHGWKVDFPAEGYRVLQPIQVRAGRVKATVYKPGGDQQGENWLIEALLTDGGPNPPAAPIFDLNIDRILNAADLYDDNPEGEIEEWHVPMIWRQADGIMSQVTIAYLDIGVDTLFINYLQQPVTADVPCAGTELCPNGFLGGHIDVQTYRGNVPLDGDRTAQAHAYDSLTQRVYVDFFDLYYPNGSDSSKSVLDQVEIDFDDSNRSGNRGNPPTTASDINENEEFIVLLANADLSPASTLRIGNKTWNAVEYQRQLHHALKTWNPAGWVQSDPTTHPLDADGDSLIFTWRAIKNAGGNISHNFDDRAILDGGLHPTQAECVMWDAAQSGRNTGGRATTGRWRNGALTTQLVKRSYFTSNPVNPAIAMVTVQQPADLPPFVITSEGDRVDTTIDYDDDQYEVVGGLVATNDAEHIWESTLFWHFGDLAEISGLGRPCYGDAGWQAAVDFELSNDPISATLDALDYDINSDTLAAAIEALRNQGCNIAGSDCYGKWTLLKTIYDISLDYIRKRAGGAISAPPPTPEQVPIVIPGGSTGAGLEGDGGDGSITDGNAYRPGRMSWTDVVK